MMRFFIVLMLLGTFQTVAAEDKPDPPTGDQPKLMRARAIEKDGSVVVSYSWPVLKPKYQTVEEEVEGKTVSMTHVTYDFVEWNETDLRIDGETVKAFGVDGEEIAAKSLLERLKKPTLVAVVLHAPRAEVKLDLYYLNALREDTVVFTAPVTTFYATVQSK